MIKPFRPIATTIFRLALLGGVGLTAFTLWSSYLVVRSPYETQQEAPREQPVAFSHKHHVGDLGLDCRYCHGYAATSSFADIPPTETCMHCHSQLWAASPALGPVRESYRTNKSIQWTKVYELPDFVYFNHSIHVHKGFGCSTCHGRVDEMPLTWQQPRLTMKWCLDCHRHPEAYVRPEADIFNMQYEPPANQAQLGKELVDQYHIQSSTSCSYCHR